MISEMLKIPFFSCGLKETKGKMEFYLHLKRADCGIWPGFPNIIMTSLQYPTQGRTTLKKAAKNEFDKTNYLIHHSHRTPLHLLSRCQLVWRVINQPCNFLIKQFRITLYWHALLQWEWMEGERGVVLSPITTEQGTSSTNHPAQTAQTRYTYINIT